MAGLKASWPGRLLRPLLRLWPDSLFGRLALLLVVVAVSSHLLAMGLRFELHPPPPSGPPVFGVDSGRPAPPHRRPPPPPLMVALDIGVRLGALVLAAWLGARWIAQPVRRLADAAQELGRDIQSPPLPERGTRECREATRVLNQMQARMRAQIEQRDLFVAAVSHDLRTPLTRLALRAEGLSDAQARERLGKDIREMDDMIRSTLDYLRGAADAEPRVRLDMAALLHSLAEDAQEVGQDVCFDAESSDGGHAPVPVQLSSIRRCLTNLIDNAVRYGGRARIRLQALPQALQIQVLDQGPGIAVQELSKVLAPFYRVDASRNRSRGGTGLGLAIADEIARRHGGRLELANRPEGGLVATLVLPR